MDNVGAVASIVGVVISVVGFIATLVNVKRSKNAAQQAKEAALQVRTDMQRVATVSEFASALTSMEDIKRLHRQKLWESLPERYSALRKSLISIRAANPDLSEGHKAALQSAVQFFVGVESEVDSCLISGSGPPDAARLNRLVSKQIDRLQAVLVTINSQIGR